jgi:hypothetical protein
VLISLPSARRSIKSEAVGGDKAKAKHFGFELEGDAKAEAMPDAKQAPVDDQVDAATAAAIDAVEGLDETTKRALKGTDGNNDRLLSARSDQHWAGLFLLSINAGNHARFSIPASLRLLKSQNPPGQDRGIGRTSPDR